MEEEKPKRKGRGKDKGEQHAIEALMWCKPGNIVLKIDRSEINMVSNKDEARNIAKHSIRKCGAKKVKCFEPIFDEKNEKVKGYRTMTFTKEDFSRGF